MSTQELQCRAALLQLLLLLLLLSRLTFPAVVVAGTEGKCAASQSGPHRLAEPAGSPGSGAAPQC